MSQKPSHQASEEKRKEISLIFNYVVECPDDALEEAKECIESFFSWKYDQLKTELHNRLLHQTKDKVELDWDEDGLTSGWLGTGGLTSMFNECNVLAYLNSLLSETKQEQQPV